MRLLKTYWPQQSLNLKFDFKSACRPNLTQTAMEPSMSIKIGQMSNLDKIPKKKRSK